MIYLNELIESDFNGMNARTIYWAFDPEIERAGTYLEPGEAKKLMDGGLALKFIFDVHAAGFKRPTKN